MPSSSTANGGEFADLDPFERVTYDLDDLRYPQVLELAFSVGDDRRVAGFFGYFVKIAAGQQLSVDLFRLFANGLFVTSCKTQEHFTERNRFGLKELAFVCLEIRFHLAARRFPIEF